MVSRDITGEPILVFSLKDVKVLMEILDRAETPEQDRVMKKIIDFINNPDCLKWEAKYGDGDV